MMRGDMLCQLPLAKYDELKEHGSGLPRRRPMTPKPDWNKHERDQAAL
jgi:hypothetical protein